MRLICHAWLVCNGLMIAYASVAIANDDLLLLQFEQNNNPLLPLSAPMHADKADFDREIGADYLSFEERRQLRISVRKGLLYDANGKLLDTAGEKFMYALSPKGTLYVSPKNRYRELYHSSFLAGQNVAGAGSIVVRAGRLIYLDNDSGHYKPTPEHLDQTLNFLASSGVSMHKVKAFIVTKPRMMMFPAEFAPRKPPEKPRISFVKLYKYSKSSASWVKQLAIHLFRPHQSKPPVRTQATLAQPRQLHTTSVANETRPQPLAFRFEDRPPVAPATPTEPLQVTTPIRTSDLAPPLTLKPKQILSRLNSYRKQR